MGEELTRSLTMLAERGEPRGAETVLANARRHVEQDTTSGWATWRRGLAVALGAAAAVVVLIGAVILFVRPFGGEEIAPVVTEPLEAVTTIPETSITGVESAGVLNRVGDLTFAPDGQLWAATGGGVVRWDIAAGLPVVFSEWDGLPSSDVSTVEVAPDGTVWIAGNGWIARYDGSWEVFSSVDVPELAGVDDLAVDRNGVVWVDGGEHLLRFDGSWTAVPMPVPAHSLAIAPDGTVWVGAGQTGVAAYDGTTWRRYTEADGVPAMRSNIAVAPDGSVWVGSVGVYGFGGYVPATGIARFDGASWKTFTAEEGLLSNDGSVVVAPDGTVWVVHDELEPDHFEPIRLSRFNGTSWTAYPELDDHHNGRGSGATVAEDGTLWIPSAAGIVGFDGTDTTLLVVPPEAAPQRLPAIILTPALGQDPIQVSTVIGDLEFTTLQYPVGHELHEVAGTSLGMFAIDSFTSLRWSTDGVTWESILPVSVDPWRITSDGEDVIVQGGQGAARHAWDGSSWTEVAVLDVPGPVNHIDFGPRDAVVVSGTTVYYSIDGVHFTPSEAGPNKEALTMSNRGCVQSGPGSYGGPDAIGPVLASEAGFVVLTPAHPDNWDRTPLCEPLLWFSEDGNRWDLLSRRSPFGETAIVHNIAEHAGRYVAVGATEDQEGDPEGAVWFSDDGVNWQKADIQLDEAVGIAGGDLGWILTGNIRDSPAVGMWFSADGATWDGPYEGPEALVSVYFLPWLAVGTDAVYGVGGTHDAIVVGRLQE